MDAVVALSLETDPFQVTSAAAWLHRRATVPPRAEQRLWIAERDGRAAGYAFCFRNFFSEGSTMAVGSVTVGSSHRRQGIGSALHERLADHAVALGATSVAAGFIENDAGVAFAAGLGYREAKAEYESVLDPRAVDASPPVDLDLRTIGDAEAHAAYEIDIAASADVPLLEPFDNVPYDEWRAHVLDHPLYTEEGSFIAYADGSPAAVSLLLANTESGRAVSLFTGTLRAFRGRGLARAAKLASIRWAAANGITTLVTQNDERNGPMLALNRQLGYERAARRVEWIKEAGTASVPAPPAPAT